MKHGKKPRSRGPTESDLHRRWLRRALDDPELPGRLRAVVNELRDNPGRGWWTSWKSFEDAVPSTALPDYIRERIWFDLVSRVASENEHGPLLDPPEGDGEPVAHDWVRDLVEDLRYVHLSQPAAELISSGGHEAGWTFFDFPIVRWSVPLAECGPVSFAKTHELVRDLERERQKARAAMLGAAPGGPDPADFQPKLPHPKAPRSLRPLMLAHMVRDLHADSGWQARVEAWMTGKRSTNKEIAQELERRHPDLDAHNLESDLSRLRQVAEAADGTGRRRGSPASRAVLGTDPMLLAIASVFQSLVQCRTNTQTPTRRDRSRRSSPSKSKRSRRSST